MRGQAFLLVLILFLAGCAEPDAERPRPDASDTTDEGLTDPPTPQNDTKDPSLGRGTETGAVGAPILHTLSPWDDREEIVVFEGRAPLSICPEELRSGSTGPVRAAESIRFICQEGRLGPDSRVPPGTEALRIEVTDASAATNGVLSALLITHRGAVLEGERLNAPPYEWTLSYEDAATQTASWNLPDHSASGYAIRITTTQAPTPDDPTAPTEGATVGVKVSALRDPTWEPIDVPDMYAVDDDRRLGPGQRLFLERAMTLESRQGRPMNPVMPKLDGDGLVPIGTLQLAIIVRWTPSLDCPPTGPCVPWVYAVNGPFLQELHPRDALGKGEGWRIHTVWTSVAEGALAWSELEPSGATNVALDVVSCASTVVDECTRGNEEAYTADYDLDVILNVETWNATVDIEPIKQRYGLE